MRQYAARLHILYEISRAILAAQSPQAIAEATLRRIQRLVPCQFASVVAFDGDELRVLATHGDILPLPASDRLPCERCVEIAALQLDDFVLLDDVLTCPRLLDGCVLASKGVRSYASVPL